MATAAALLTAVTVASTVVSTAATVYGGYTSYRAGKSAERAKKKQAAEARRQAEVRATQEEERHRRILATQRAKYGFYGFDIEGGYGMIGSPLEVRLESLRQSARDIAEIRRGGVAAESALLSEAKWHGYMGESEMAAGWLRGGTSLLTGAGEVAGIGMEQGWW